MAKLVYAWGQRRRLLKLNDLALYRFKIAKEDRRELPAEYRLEDFDKILRQFDPSQWGQWRPWALLTLLGTQGIRNNSARHLQWADVDLEDGTLAWRARWDKLGREWRQPLRSEARAALMVCLAWREKANYHGPWVFFSQDERRAKHDHEPVYGHQALAYALQKGGEGGRGTTSGAPGDAWTQTDGGRGDHQADRGHRGRGAFHRRQGP